MSKVAEAAEAVKAEVAKIKQSAQILVEEISVDTNFAKGKLEAAKPALDEAEAALNVKPFKKIFIFHLLELYV